MSAKHGRRIIHQLDDDTLRRWNGKEWAQLPIDASTLAALKAEGWRIVELRPTYETHDNAETWTVEDEL